MTRLSVDLRCRAPLHSLCCLALSVFSLSSGVGCEGDDVDGSGATRRNDRDGDDVDPSSDEEPLYIVKTRVFSPDDTTTYFTPTSDLSDPPDYDRAYTVMGSGQMYSRHDIGAFVIGDGEEPVITRLELTGDGDFVEGEKLSFANEGVDRLNANAVVFASATKAYYIDDSQLQAIVFDPSEMAITKRISLEDAARDGYDAWFGIPVVRDDGVFFPGHWSREDGTSVPMGAMLFHIDPETDAVTVTEDERCSGMYFVLQTDNGDTYWFSFTFNVVARREYDGGVPDCALRLQASETTFDPSWELDIAERTDGAAAVAALHGGGSVVWLRVLDESLTGDLPSPAEYGDLDTIAAWRWYSIDLESDEPALPNRDVPPSSVGALGIYVDGRSFVTRESPDYASGALIELTEEGFVERYEVTGIIDGIGRVR